MLEVAGSAWVRTEGCGVGRGEEPRAMPRIFRVEALPGSEFRSERLQGTCRAELRHLRREKAAGRA